MDNAEKKPWDSVDPREITNPFFDFGNSFVYQTRMIQANPHRKAPLTGEAFVRTSENGDGFNIRYNSQCGPTEPIDVHIKCDPPEWDKNLTFRTDFVPNLYMKQGDAEIALYLTPDICHRLIRMLNEVLQTHSNRALK